MLRRLWTLISLAWTGFCLYGFYDSGEIHHLTLENYALLFAPFLLRFLVLFVMHGLPRPSAW